MASLEASTVSDLKELLKTSPIALNVSTGQLKESSLRPKQFAQAEEVSDSDTLDDIEIVTFQRESKKEKIFSEEYDSNKIVEPRPAVERNRTLQSKSPPSDQPVRAKQNISIDVEVGGSDDNKEEFKPDATKSFEEYQERVVATNPVSRQSSESEPDSSKSSAVAPRSNPITEAKKPMPRRHVRGVTHPQPVKMKMGALITLCLLLSFPVSILLLGSILLGAPKWVLFGSAVVVIFFVLYLLQALSCRCRVCGQAQFAPKNCRRHVKAHRVKGVGYIIPTALHMLLFSWFRCIFCGTAISLKGKE